MKTVVFDFDDTLVDTFDIAVNVYNKVAPIFRIRRIARTERETVKNFSLNEFAVKYRIASYKFLPLVIFLRFLMVREKKRKKISFFPGTVQMIRDLRNSGFRCGILTTNSRRFVSSLLEKEKLSECFSFIETNPFLRGKHKSLEKLKKFHGDFVYVCDEGRDVVATKEAGVVSVAVTWGFNSAENLLRFSPDFIISSPQEFFNVLKDL
ncbi:HAD hydrolase-like protein [Desulfurobacterium sp.]